MLRTMGIIVTAVGMLGSAVAPAGAADGVAERFTRIARSLDWQLVETVAVQFPTHHPQGMVKIGDRIYFSTVEILEPTQRYPEPRDGLDRSAGKGVGHLFEMDLKGALLREIQLGEGDVYHPGGIDFDGTHIWVPVAEYRPNSHAIIYRVDPNTMATTKVLTFADHVGGIVHDPATGTLHGVSWGSRRMKPDAPPFPLGGLELIDLKTDRPLHQIPVALWTDTGV